MANRNDYIQRFLYTVKTMAYLFNGVVVVPRHCSLYVRAPYSTAVVTEDIKANNLGMSAAERAAPDQ